MKTIIGNLWDQQGADALVITTNGFVKANGECVMGRGCAKEAVERFPGISKHLGALLGVHGNRVLRLVSKSCPHIVSFPVKPVSEPYDGTNAVAHMAKTFVEGQMVPGWACKARIEIILRSAHELVAMTDKFGWQRVVLPYPGCGAGELSWDDVGPLLAAILDDRFEAITFR